jgi:hypothetical protein
MILMLFLCLRCSFLVSMTCGVVGAWMREPPTNNEGDETSFMASSEDIDEEDEEEEDGTLSRWFTLSSK